MQEPLVSVVIPFYSGVLWLREAIESVLSQTYTNYEIIVVIDGSKENLIDIKNDYAKTVRFINKENGGPSSARNKGLELSKGKYIAFLDSDDIWMETKLEKQIKGMEENNWVWSQHSYEMFWDKRDKKKVVDTSRYFGNVYRDCYISFKIQTSSVIVLKQVLVDNKIEFPHEMRYGQDVEFYRQIAQKYELGYIDDILSRFRIRGNNAGFQALIQLEDKAMTWNRIKNNKNILGIFPTSIVFAYKLSNSFNKIIKRTYSHTSRNKKKLEFLAKTLYLFPYILFKFNSRILAKR